jgi:hypothetical protein
MMVLLKIINTIRIRALMVVLIMRFIVNVSMSEQAPTRLTVMSMSIRGIR